MPGLGQVVTFAVDKLAEHERLASVVTRGFERAGALTLADRLDGRLSDGDLAAIAIRPTPTALRAHRIKMYRLGGSDQIVRVIGDHGWRAFERPLPDAFCLLVRELGSGVVLDVGANTGFYSLVAVSASKRIVVEAFEPARQILPVLEKNVEICADRKRISIHAMGVSDHCGLAELYIPPPTGVVETSSSLESAFKQEHHGSYQVPVTTLDQFWSDAGRPTVTLVKVDVEGHELPALQGAAQMVDGCRPILIVEVLPGAPMSALDDFLSTHKLVDIRMSAYELVIGDAIKWHELAWNHLFVPREKLSRVVNILRSLDVIVTELAVG